MRIWERARRSILRVSVGLAATYGVVTLAAWLCYKRFLFPVPAARAAPTVAGADLWTLRAGDGVAVHALAFGGPPSATPNSPPVIVHFHGNGETMFDSVALAHNLVNRGVRVVLVEYRGYGTSAGAPITEDGLYQDAEAVLDALREKGNRPGDIVLWGTSLGTGVAAEMARRGRGSALVLVTPYTSIPDVAASYTLVLPVRMVVAEKFDTLSKVESIRVPTLIVHGDRDQVVPYAMGERLAGAIPGARFTRIPGGHHNDLFAMAGDRILTDVMDLVNGRASAAR